MQLPPQVPVPVHRVRPPTGCWPFGRLVQVPTEADRLQAWHCPVQSLSQQTLSAQ